MGMTWPARKLLASLANASTNSAASHPSQIRLAGITSTREWRTAGSESISGVK
jgi:hypothetical protein